MSIGQLSSCHNVATHIFQKYRVQAFYLWHKFCPLNITRHETPCDRPTADQNRGFVGVRPSIPGSPLFRPSLFKYAELKVGKSSKGIMQEQFYLRHNQAGQYLVQVFNFKCIQKLIQIWIRTGALWMFFCQLRVSHSVVHLC